MEIYSAILTVHVVSGFTALAVGLVPMFSKKGSSLHVKSGRVYFWAMFGVFLTSSLMFIFKPDRLLFLFLVGVFSFYQTFSGSRVIRYKSPSVPISLFDKAMAFLMGLSGFTMIGLGINSFLNELNGVGTVYLVFGCVLASQGFADFILFTRNWESVIENEPETWLYRHISRMGGSYIATFTAFIVVNNTFLPALIGWLGPGLIGGIIVSQVIKKYKMKAVR